MSKAHEPPLFAGTIRGLRTWVLQEHPPTGETRLGAYFTNSLWTPGGAWTEAACQATGSRQHRAPRHDCSCGLYACHPSLGFADALYHEHLDADGMGWGQDPCLPDLAGVTGMIEASGRIEVHQTGFRAERARVQALFVGRDWPPAATVRVAEIAAAYGAQILDVGDPEELVAHCHEGGSVLSAEQVDELLASELSEFERMERPSPPVNALRRALGTLGQAIGYTIFALFCLAYYGAIAAFVVAIAIGILFGWPDPEPAPPPPARVAEVRVNREKCSIAAEVIARRRVEKLMLRTTGRDAAGEGAGHLTDRYGAVGRGRTWVEVADLDRKPCRAQEPFTVRVRPVWPERLGAPAEVRSKPTTRPKGHGSDG